MAPTADMGVQLETFSRICFPPWYPRIRTPTLRPERPEFSFAMRGQGDQYAKAKRQAVVRLLYDRLVRGTHAGRRPMVHLARHRCIIIGLAAVLFDQECAAPARWPGGPVPMASPGFPWWSSFVAPPLSLLARYGRSGPELLASLIEHMLLVDYGFGEQPLRKLGSEPAWVTNLKTRVVCHDFCERLTKLADDCRSGEDKIGRYRLAWMDESLKTYEDNSSANDDFSDVSLMLYLFWTRRHEITKDEYSRGLTGYEGVLQEMMSETPAFGTGRLTRKLSADVNKLIPQYVKDNEVKASMIAKARRTAMEYGIRLQVPYSPLTSLLRPRVFEDRVDTRRRPPEPDEYYGLSLDRLPTPPPSYNEAVMSLPIFSYYMGHA